MKPFLARLLLFWATAHAAACNHPDQVAGRSKAGGGVYADYRVWSEEGKEDATCLLQFRSGGPNGPAFALEAPLKIELDGEVVPPDSARLSGVFYEITKPVYEFTGKHSLVFTDAQGKQHREEFEFIPFSLEAGFPQKVKRKPFTIRLGNFPKARTPVHLMLVDTAFETNDINEITVVSNGKLTISEPMLRQLKTGPIFFELVKEEERSLKKGPGGGGRIVVSYGVKREFELVN